MDQPGRDRLLLQLIGTATAPDLSGLSAADWTAIDRKAAQHRLQPLLHSLHRDNASVPDDLRALWQQVHRAWAIAALTSKADLQSCLQLLRGEGIEPLALKGAWLAWCAYPEAAQRPLRDIDLLVREDQFEQALSRLMAAGFTYFEEPDLPLAELLLVDKSPPPLKADRGTAIELHFHAWFPEGRLEYYSPPPDDAGMFARARREANGVLYPDAADMLAHLIIHAVYGHRLDCGPLLLADIDFLLRRDPIDWAEFWARCEREGWNRGARLVLDLVGRHRILPSIDWSNQTPPTPPELLDSAEELLLQDLDTRLSAGVAATGISGLFKRMRRRVSTADGASVSRDSTSEGGYLSWAWSRFSRTASDLVDPAVRRQSRQLGQLSRWLDVR